MNGGIRTIVLDFDGVLLESEASKASAFDEVFGDYPRFEDEMKAFNRGHYSLPRRAKFEHCVFSIMARHGDVAEVESMLERFSALVVRRVAACDEVLGASDFLREFAPQVPLYVSSVTPERELRAVIRERGWERYFAGVFGDPPTPKPDAIRAILAREGVAARDVVFVGDSAGDARAASETGVGFIARDSGLTFHPFVVDPYADMRAVAQALRSRIAVRT